MFCPQCGNAVEAVARFCSKCSSKLPQEIPGVRAHDTESSIDDRGMDSKELDMQSTDVEVGTDDVYKAILGPRNQGAYLRHFSRFDSDGKTSTSWHWPALFVTFYWLLYRKMWLNALAYFLLPFIAIVLLAIGASAGMSENIIVGLSVLFLAIIWLLPPIYANAIYYRHCKKIIQKKARSPSYDLPGLLEGLSSKGGTGNVVLIMAFVFASIGLTSAIAIPKYQEYVAFSRDRLSDAESAGAIVSEPVANHSSYQQIPGSVNMYDETRLTTSDQLERGPVVMQTMDEVIDPSEDEITAFFNAHPDLFANRKLYRLQEISITAPTDRHDAIRAQLGASKYLNEFTEWLKVEKLQFKAEQGVKSAEKLPLQMLHQLAKMPDGQAMVVNSPDGLMVIVLADSQVQSVTLEQARPAIVRWLQQQ